MYLLDTNHCSRIILGDKQVLNQLGALAGIQVSICAIVRGELIYMAERSQQKASNLQLIHAFLQSIHSYDVDEVTADVYGQFKAEILEHFGPRERSKRRKARVQELGISDNDLWIAAIALQHSLTVVSSDSDFVR